MIAFGDVWVWAAVLMIDHNSCGVFELVPKQSRMSALLQHVVKAFEMHSRHKL